MPVVNKLPLTQFVFVFLKKSHQNVTLAKLRRLIWRDDTTFSIIIGMVKPPVVGGLAIFHTTAAAGDIFCSS